MIKSIILKYKFSIDEEVEESIKEENKEKDK